MISFEETITIKLDDEHCYNDAIEEWENDSSLQEEYGTFEQWLKQEDFVENWLMGMDTFWFDYNYDVARDYCLSKSVDKLEQAVIERYQQDNKKKE